METKLFSNAKYTDDFKADLVELLGLSADIVKECIKNIPNIILNKDKHKLKEVVEGIVNKYKCSESSIYNAIGIMFHFANRFIDEEYANDTIEGWGKDLCELGFIDVNMLDLFVEYMAKIKKDVSEQYEINYIINKYSSGLLPSFVSIDSTTELRSVHKKQFRYESNIKDYIPRIEGLVPIITINIELDNNDQSINFQATESQIKNIIAYLQASVSDLKQLKDQYVNLKIMNA